MSKTTVLKTTNKGGGFVTVHQHADDKQLSPERIEKFVSDGAGSPYKLQAVNNATDTMKVNPLARENDPDTRVYTLLLASKIKSPKS